MVILIPDPVAVQYRGESAILHQSFCCYHVIFLDKL
jgi:hypothetical protein